MSTSYKINPRLLLVVAGIECILAALWRVISAMPEFRETPLQFSTWMLWTNVVFLGIGMIVAAVEYSNGRR